MRTNALLMSLFIGATSSHFAGAQERSTPVLDAQSQIRCSAVGLLLAANHEEGTKEQLYSVSVSLLNRGSRELIELLSSTKTDVGTEFAPFSPDLVEEHPALIAGVLVGSVFNGELRAWEHERKDVQQAAWNQMNCDELAAEG